MGCDGSKASGEGRDGDNDVVEYFTDNQIDTIRSTWPLLSRDMTLHGVQLFLMVFETEPKIKLAFRKFSAMKDGEMSEDIEFQAHVTKFMKLINEIVDNLDVQKDEVEKSLMMLGAKHASFGGFRSEYLGVYSKCMLQLLESVIGEEFIPEIKESWTALFSYIARYMTQGSEIYFEDQHNDNEQVFQPQIHDENVVDV